MFGFVKKNLRLILAVVLICAIGFGAFVYQFFTVNALPGDLSYAIDIAEIRTLADSINGAKPNATHMEKVATFDWPEWALLAGGGLSLRPMGAYSFQLVSDDGFTIIDAALNEEQCQEMPGTAFHQEPFDRMIAALEQADCIVITHEHLDHFGGITTHPDVESLKPALRLTREQLSNPDRLSSPPVPAALLKDYEALDYETAHAVAPGVVVLKSPGHTVGSQMVFVALADGSEVLFLGDVAWMAEGFKEMRARPRFVSSVALPDGENRNAVAAQLAALHALSVAEPDLTIVAGHDGIQIASLVSDGILKPEFLLPETVAEPQ